MARPWPRKTGLDRPRLPDREHDDRHPVLAGKREGGRIHDLQITFDRLLVGQAVIADGLWVLLGIGAVDAVDVGGLQHRLGADFGGPQHRRGVGREERIAGAAGEQHHPVLAEMPQRPPPLVGLADLRHRHRRHRPRRAAGRLDRGFERERVHDGGEHAHQIAGHARDALLGHLHAAKDIAAADDNSDADAQRLGGDEIGGDALERWLMDAEAVRAHQGLAGDLDDHASVDRLSHGVSALPVCGRPSIRAAEPAISSFPPLPPPRRQNRNPAARYPRRAHNAQSP